MKRKGKAMTLAEALGLGLVDPDEIELPKTNNWNNIQDPNWESDTDKFDLGLFNANNSTLSNLLVKKLGSKLGKGKDVSISEILELNFNFVLSLIKTLFNLNGKKKR